MGNFVIIKVLNIYPITKIKILNKKIINEYIFEKTSTQIKEP